MDKRVESPLCPDIQGLGEMNTLECMPTDIQTERVKRTWRNESGNFLWLWFRSYTVLCLCSFDWWNPSLIIPLADQTIWWQWHLLLEVNGKNNSHCVVMGGICSLHWAAMDLSGSLSPAIRSFLDKELGTLLIYVFWLIRGGFFFLFVFFTYWVPQDLLKVPD